MPLSLSAGNSGNLKQKIHLKSSNDRAPPLGLYRLMLTRGSVLVAFVVSLDLLVDFWDPVTEGVDRDADRGAGLEAGLWGAERVAEGRTVALLVVVCGLDGEGVTGRTSLLLTGLEVAAAEI